MPPLTLRQEFPTLRHFKEALHAWAIEAHFEPRILKSDTGRVRVGCKRDPNCPFVIRCNWERKNGREPLARVTVLKERHTCLNGLVGAGDNNGAERGWESGGGDMVGVGGMMGGLGGLGMDAAAAAGGLNGLEIRTAQDGSIIGGARVLGPASLSRSASNTAAVAPSNLDPSLAPVLPKVQRNSASRLPFLMEILPRLMRITKETTPVEIRECLMREYGAEVHLQQCRRAKTEILKRQAEGEGSGGADVGGRGSSVDGIGEPDDTAPAHTANMFSTPSVNNGSSNGRVHDMSHSHSHSHSRGQGSGPQIQHQTPHQPNQNIPQNQNQQSQNQNQRALENRSQSTPSTLHATPNMTSGSLSLNPALEGGGGADDFPLHTASGVVIPQATPRREAALNAAAGEQPVRCPYCVNHRWMRSVRDAVEHMSMHVVV